MTSRTAVRQPRQRPTARQWSVDFRRAVRRHRRKLAVLATVAAVLTGLTALAPPRPDTVTVVTASRALAAGSTITSADLGETALPARAVPAGAWSDPTELIGQQVAGPVPERQVLTRGSLLRHRARGTGAVVAPLPLADDRVSGLIEAGDVVDVLAAENETGKTRVVASAVRVITGAIGDSDGGSGTGGLVLVEVSPHTAAALAGAASVSVLSVVWR